MDMQSMSDRLERVEDSAGPAHTGAKHAKILLEEPMTNWKDALSDLRSHGSLFVPSGHSCENEGFPVDERAPG